MAQGTAEYPDVWRQNVLFRLKPGGNIQRATFTRATAGTYVNHQAVGASAAINTLRLTWVDLDGDGYRETPGFLLEGARSQIITQPENFGAWTLSGTPVLTSGQADPFGATSAYSINDDSAAAIEWIVLNAGFTGDGTKAMALFLKAGTAGASAFRMEDTSVPATRLRIDITWSGGIPTPVIGTGSGVLHTTERYANGWYRFLCTVNSVIAANVNRFEIFPTNLTAANVGTVFAFGANAWNAPFPTSYQGPALASLSADVFTVPLVYGPCDLTVLARIVRPLHCDAGAAADLGLAPGIFGIGDTGPASGGQVRASFQQTSRNVEAAIDTSVTDRTGTAAVIAGTQTIVAQYRNLTTGGLTKIDAGAGFGTESAAATPFLSFNGANLHIGRTAAGSELFGVLLDLLVVRGLQTRQNMIALAGI